MACQGDQVNSIISSITESAVAKADSGPLMSLEKSDVSISETVIKVNNFCDDVVIKGNSFERVRNNDGKIEARKLVEESIVSTPVVESVEPEKPSETLTVVASASKHFQRSESSLLDLKSAKPQSASSKVTNRQSLASQSTVSSGRPGLNKEHSSISMSSTTSKLPTTKKPAMILPHPLGTKPAYLKSKESSSASRPSTACQLNVANTKTRLISSSPSETPSSNGTDTAKNEIKLLNYKLVESRRETTELRKSLKMLQSEISDTKSLLSESEKRLKKESEQLKNLQTQNMTRRREENKINATSQETVDSLKASKDEIDSLKKLNEELMKKAVRREELNDKATKKADRMERDLKKEIQRATCLEKELIELKQSRESSKDNQKDEKPIQRKSEKRIKELEKTLATRDYEISGLKDDIEKLIDEISSLKSKSELVKFTKKFEGGDNDKLDISGKAFEQKSIQEIQTLNSKLADEKQKLLRTENILELRGEYIKTLQEVDETNKSRLVIQLQENAILLEKLEKAKKFKAAFASEKESMYETLKSQENQIMQLRLSLEQKDKKIAKYESRLEEAKNR